MKIKKWLKRISLGIVALIVLVLASAFTYEQASRVIVERRFSPEGEMVDIGGHRLHMLKQGTGGPTVVFESGLDTAGHLSWYKVEEEISRFATTVSYDRAGILWSERGNRPKTGEAIADDLNSLLVNGGLPKPYIVVGHSLAGITLRKFVAKYGKDIAGVVLVDVSHPDQAKHFPPKVPSSLVMGLMSSFGLIRFTSGRQMPNTDLADRINQVGPSLIHRSLAGTFEEAANLVQLSSEASQITSFGDIPVIVISAASPSLGNGMPVELREEMGRLRREFQEDQLTLSSDTQHVRATGSTHYVQLEQPEIVIAAIKQLIAKITNN